MNHSSSEQLLGYLLGALDDHEHQQLDEELGRRPELRRELESMRQQLKLLDVDRDLPEPREDLAYRTCLWIHEQLLTSHEVTAVQPRTASAARKMSVREETVGRRGMSLADFIVTAGILVAVSMLFFPALSNSRMQAQLNGCQDNLRRIGQALWDHQTYQHSLPTIEMTGNRSVAGVYAPLLIDQEFLRDPSVLLCPSSPLAVDRAAWRGVPRLRELDAATGESLREMQQQMGGSYGYSLGYVVGGRYVVPRQSADPNFAIMADAPSVDLDARQSRNHGRRGQNVLYADNHIRFSKNCETSPCDDSLFLNRQGFAAVGLDERDTVIGRSETSPFSQPGLPIQLINNR